MMSKRKAGADRANPNGSTGPRSAAGKARSSMNALKSGIYSKSLTIPGEDPAKLTTLTEEYFERYRPALPEQRDLVDILVRSTWTLRRLAAAEAQVWIYEMDIRCELHPTAPLGQAFHHCDRTLTRLQRMVNSAQRNHRDALHELERLQPRELDLQPVPAPAPVPQESRQQIENKPVNQSKEFVSSASTPPPPAAPKATPKTTPKAPQAPLPFHQPGSHCPFSPTDPAAYRRCPYCFPDDSEPDVRD